MVSPMSLHQRFLVCTWISSCQKPSTPLSEWNTLPRLFVSVPVPHHYLPTIIGLSAIFLSGDFFLASLNHPQERQWIAQFSFSVFFVSVLHCTGIEGCFHQRITQLKKVYITIQRYNIIYKLKIARR